MEYLARGAEPNREPELALLFLQLSFLKNYEFIFIFFKCVERER